MDELFEVKQELIDISDDEEIKHELMDVKIEEETDFFFAPPPPPPSDELLDLQQKVLKLENDFQGACRIALESQLRVKFLEDLLEKRPQSSDNSERKLAEMQKKLSEATMKLDEAVRKEEEEKRKNADMAQENAALKSENEELKKKRGPSMFDIDQEPDPEVKFRLKFNALTRQLNEKVQKAEEDRTRDRARIDELSRKLAKYESGQQRPQVPPPYNANTTSNVPAPEHAPLALIVQIPPHPRNIFEPVPRHTVGSMSYAHARNVMYKKSYWKNTDWRGQFVKAVYDDNIDCKMCNKQLKGAHVLGHFISENHAKTVRDCNTAVSAAAFSYWMSKLESIPKPAVDTAPRASAASAVVAETDQRTYANNNGIGGQASQVLDWKHPSNKKITTSCPSTASLAKTVHNYPHPTNITEPCSSNIPESMPYTLARESLLKKHYSTDLEWRSQFQKIAYEDRFFCTICKKKNHGARVFYHFVSTKHAEAMRDCNGAVSATAFSYWMSKLESIPKPTVDTVAAHGASQPGASVAGNTAQAQGFHPMNIFELSPYNSRGSIPYDLAYNAMRKKYHLENLEWKEKFVQAVYNDNLECKMCQVQVSGAFVLSHFFSGQHFEKLRECNSAVSEAAFWYWMSKLESIQKTSVDTVAAPGPSAATTANGRAVAPAPNGREHSMEEESPLVIKKEQCDEFEGVAPVFSPVVDEAPSEMVMAKKELIEN